MSYVSFSIKFNRENFFYFFFLPFIHLLETTIVNEWSLIWFFFRTICVHKKKEKKRNRKDKMCLKLNKIILIDRHKFLLSLHQTKCLTAARHYSSDEKEEKPQKNNRGRPTQQKSVNYVCLVISIWVCVYVVRTYKEMFVII